MKIKHQFLILVLLISTKFIFAQPTIISMNVYPNPFSDEATIQFDLAENDTISLTLFSITGREISNIIKDSIFLQGSYTIILSGDSLPDGIYILSLQFGLNKFIRKKILKVSSSSISESLKYNQTNLLYPNPVKETLYIDIEGLKTILISNSLGEIVKSFQTQSKAISFSELLPGIYFISVFDDENKMVKTLRILHE